ncbi:hypothetical protein [Nocardia sp. 852002-20019_SCH5090214]|uniref:hypothetical protein n=1 Tax=Nocardia sp. 852002-20019_SCH5090214 TaxID=1834087 RepID=UPI000AE7CE54|nr:hypothetical protein [Nocardia sp. 852002-20019_SCH5090214]
MTKTASTLRITRRTRPKPATPESPSPEDNPTPAPGSTPPQPGGKVCAECGCYVVNVALHDDFHRKLNGWVRHINAFEALVKRIFRALGYITPTDGDTTPNSGNIKENQ